MTPHQRVELTWWDAHGDGGWVRHDEIITDPCIVTSVGYLVPGAMPGHITVVQSVQGDHNDNRLHVPLGMVRSIAALAPTGVQIGTETAPERDSSCGHTCDRNDPERAQKAQV